MLQVEKGKKKKRRNDLSSLVIQVEDYKLHVLTARQACMHPISVKIYSQGFQVSNEITQKTLHSSQNKTLFPAPAFALLYKDQWKARVF